MDRLLRQQLNGIVRDRRSGAAELALRGVMALQAWLRRHPKPTEQELLEIARTLLHAKPSMAPLLRLANEVALAVDASTPARALSTSVAEFKKILRTGPIQIARLFSRWLGKGPRREIFTYSYSSTVVRALIHARGRIEKVCCSESRPGYEGFTTATRLSRAGIETEFLTDVGLFSQLWERPLVVLGADAVLRGWIAGKVGTKVLARGAFATGGTAIFVADTTKFWAEPSGRSPRWECTFGPDEELWKNPPTRVRVHNLYFELTPLSPRMRVLTERGWMTRKQARRELKKIKISPRLKALAG